MNWNRELLNYVSCVLFEIVGVMAFKPVLASASCVFDIDGFGEIGEIDFDNSSPVRCPNTVKYHKARFTSLNSSS